MKDEWDHISANHFVPYEKDILCLLTFSIEGQALLNASTIQKIEEHGNTVVTNPIVKSNAMLIGLDIDDSEKLWAVDLRGNVFTNDSTLANSANNPQIDPIYDCEPNWTFKKIVDGVVSCIKHHQGSVFVATFTGEVYRIDGKNKTIAITTAKAQPFRFRSLKDLYLTTKSCLLRLEANDKWIPIWQENHEGQELVITDVVEWGSSSYAFSKDGHIFTIEEDKLILKMKSESPIFEVAKVPAGLAMASGTEGIKLYDGTQITHLRNGDYVGAMTMNSKTFFRPASTKKPWIVCFEHASQEWSKWSL